MKRLSIILLITTFIITIACEEIDNRPPEFSLSTLLAAPDTLVYKNKHLTLNTSIWYDKMPMVPETAPRFGALFTISTIDSSDIDFNVDIKAYYLVRDNEVFSALTANENYPNNFSYKYEKIGRTGPPDWEYKSITVVVLVILDGKQSLLKAENQFIDVAY